MIGLLRWLLCALAPAWLVWSASPAAAATEAVASLQLAASTGAAVATDEAAATEEAAATDVESVAASAQAAARTAESERTLRDESAPMCDPHGASVAATPVIPEIDHGKLEQLPCDDAWQRWLSAALEHARGQSTARDGVPASPPSELQLDRVHMDGVIPLVIALPERAQPARLPRSEVAGLPARAGHRLSIYRPPARGR